MALTKEELQYRTDYNKVHKAKHRLYSYRSYARKFIREMATLDDIDELETLLQTRKQKLTTSRINLDADTLSWIQQQADALGLSLNDFINVAIKNGIKDEAN